MAVPWISSQSTVRTWQPLEKYIEKLDTTTTKLRAKENFRKFMNDKVFRLKLIFLNGVIEIVNLSNKAFQNQSMEIHDLYSEAVKCF